MSEGKAVAGEQPLKLWKGTRLSTLLLIHPRALDVLLEFDPALALMRDPEVRAVQAHRLTLGDVALRVGKPIEDLLDALKRALQTSQS